MTTNPLRDQIAALPAHQPMLEFEDEESTAARCVMRQVDDGFWVRKRSVLAILDAQAPQPVDVSEGTIHAHQATLVSPDAHQPAPDAVAEAWQPIETAPKDGKIDIWAVDNGGKGRRVSDCYHDHICDEWRTTAPGLYLHRVKARYVTHWMTRPAPPALASQDKEAGE